MPIGRIFPLVFAALGALLAGCPTASPPTIPPTAIEPPAAPPTTPVAPATPPTTPPTAPENPPPPPAAVAPPEKQPLADWEQPAVALFLTGQQLGYIEPCGCTGLENQKGGLARRHSLLKQLTEEKGWTVVPLDVGNQVRRFGKQSEIKFQRTADALRLLGYRAVAFGPEDLRLPPGELLSGTNPDDKPSIFTSGNIALIERSLQPRMQVIAAGGRKIGVVAILADSFEQKLQGDELVRQAAQEGLATSCEELKAAGCDYHVLLAHAPPDEAKQLAQAAGLFDLVVIPGFSLPSTVLEAIEGTKARLLKVSHKGMHVSVVGLSADKSAPIRHENVPLDARLPDSPAMLAMLAEFQEQLKSEGLAGLGLKPQPHPTGRKFVGSEKCGECHTKAYEIWSKTPHAHATESLVHPPNSRGDIPRHFDPECLSCHVTGWEPQKIYPYESGYLGLTQTPLLKDNGCENCHGPGAEHAAAESGEGNPTADLLSKLRDQMKLPLAGGVAENKCRECHDEDNSPDFSHKGFAAYWKEVEHQGKD
ncbi:MAG: multiheme c-type cytochrome [Pirellulaceae bacterium]|nr:multiheme c-type cytochrome [Pirellulaceae bacterium]